MGEYIHYAVLNINKFMVSEVTVHEASSDACFEFTSASSPENLVDTLHYSQGCGYANGEVEEVKKRCGVVH